MLVVPMDKSMVEKMEENLDYELADLLVKSLVEKLESKLVMTMVELLE
jgi:hypothetical protein